MLRESGAKGSGSHRINAGAREADGGRAVRGLEFEEVVEASHA